MAILYSIEFYRVLLIINHLIKNNLLRKWFYYLIIGL